MGTKIGTFIFQISHVLELHPADHIAFPRFLSPEADWFKLYWHHAIIEDIDYESELIRVIHFQPVFDEGFKEQKERENNQLELFNAERRSVSLKISRFRHGLEKWKNFFHSRKNQGILNRLEKSGNFPQNIGKMRECSPKYWKSEGILAFVKYIFVFVKIIK